MSDAFRAFGCLTVLLGLAVSCTSTSPFMHSKVPMDQLKEIQAIGNPLPQSYTVITEGKALYEGKGICVRCHGIHGDGKGIAAKNFQTLPRNFKNRDFWNQRKEGELFWIVKHGSPGTGMRDFQSLLTDQEIWKILRYTETFPNMAYPSDPVEPTPPPELVNPLQGAY